MQKHKNVTVHSVHSNLVKIHSKSPSVMGFCHIHGKTPRGILPVNSNIKIASASLFTIYHLLMMQKRDIIRRV